MANLVTITRTVCGSYTVTNDESAANLIFIFEQLVNGVYVELYRTGSIPPAGTYTQVFSPDGIYRITVGVYNDADPANPTKLDYYDIVVYCAIATCMINYITTLICSNDTDCAMCAQSKAAKLYYYNTLMLTYYVFMMELNGLYVNNWAYTILDPNDLTKLATIETLLTKMIAYCTCIDKIDGSGDCGCGC